jgi:N-acetyltransferase 10
MMALYVASHYKNSPNDLQLMADAPAHHLFVLLGISILLLTGFTVYLK